MKPITVSIVVLAMLGLMFLLTISQRATEGRCLAGGGKGGGLNCSYPAETAFQSD